MRSAVGLVVVDVIGSGNDIFDGNLQTIVIGVVTAKPIRPVIGTLYSFSCVGKIAIGARH